MSRRLWALTALVVGTATVVLGVVVSVQRFPSGLVVLACVVVAGAAGWYGLLRRGAARAVGMGVAALALLGALVLVLTQGGLLLDLLVVVGLLATSAATRATQTVHVDLPKAAAPRHPVLFFNPRSGG